MSKSNEAVVVLNAHIKKLENQKAALDQKFRRCHTKEFLDEMSKLRHETLSLDVLKEIDKFRQKETCQNGRRIRLLDMRCPRKEQ